MENRGFDVKFMLIVTLSDTKYLKYVRHCVFQSLQFRVELCPCTGQFVSGRMGWRSPALQSFLAV